MEVYGRIWMYMEVYGSIEVYPGKWMYVEVYGGIRKYMGVYTTPRNQILHIWCEPMFAPSAPMHFWGTTLMTKFLDVEREHILESLSEHSTQ